MKRFRKIVGVSTPLIVQLFILSTLLSLASCRTISPTQLSQIDKFATSCGNFTRYPSTLFTELAEIRLERGLYFTATVTDSKRREEELNSLSKAYDNELLVAKKCDKVMDVIKSYSSALKILSSNARWEERGREIRSLGRTLDSLSGEINRLKVFKEIIPIGIAKSATILIGYGSQQRVKRRQYRVVKEFIESADTLIAEIAEGVNQLLRDNSTDALLEGEKMLLPQSYRSYISLVGGSLESDREYLALLKRVEQLTYLRGYITAAFTQLVKGHHQLLLSFEKGRDMEEIWDSLLKFYDDVEMLEREYKKIERLLSR